MSEIPELDSEFHIRLSTLYSLRDRWENLKRSAPTLRDDKSRIDKLDGIIEVAISNTSNSKPLPKGVTVENVQHTVETMETWFSTKNRS